MYKDTYTNECMLGSNHNLKNDGIKYIIFARALQSPALHCRVVQHWLTLLSRGKYRSQIKFTIEKTYKATICILIFLHSEPISPKLPKIDFSKKWPN